jgi:hypothetical protein
MFFLYVHPERFLKKSYRGVETFFRKSPVKPQSRPGLIKTRMGTTILIGFFQMADE